MEQFKSLKASELYCPRCSTSRPVRERLLLVLPHAEIYEYRCVACATSLGQREVTGPTLQAAARPPPPTPPRAAPAPRRAPRGFLGAG